MSEARTACPHCHAPRLPGARVQEGRICCDACDKWYADRYHPPAPAPAPAPAAPAPAAPRHKGAAPVLPDDLLALGFRIVCYDDGYAAVSSAWGCSERSADDSSVIASARNIASFIRWVKQKQQEEAQQ